MFPSLVFSNTFILFFYPQRTEYWEAPFKLNVQSSQEYKLQRLSSFKTHTLGHLYSSDAPSLLHDSVAIRGAFGV